MSAVPDLARLRDNFTRVFPLAQRKLAVARAPGRVNVIGEHTDYNEGYVLPAAVTRSTWAVAQRRTDTKVAVFSANIEEKVEFDVRTMRFDTGHGWANYPKAVLHALANRGWKLDGLNLYLESDVPLGGGMSSSAALECAVTFACQALFPYQIDRLSVAKICQKAENQFIGVQCGIMDQYAAVFGRKGHALFLDCRSLKCEHVPLPAEAGRLLVVNSGVKRKLASGEYNKRREQCGEALKLLRPRFPQAKALRDLAVSALPGALAGLPDVPRKRAEHVIRECGRVLDAVAALRRTDLKSVGRLMNESHASLRDLYEVSCPELDTLAATAQQAEGVFGARMMGGGFGGCLIALVAPAAAERVVHDVSRVYQHRYGLRPDAWLVDTGDGAGELQV